MGHEIEGAATIINDGKKVGGGGSLTYREIYGQGVKIPGGDFSDIITRERTFNGQATKGKNGRIEANGGYKDKNIYKQALSIGDKEVSRSIYNTQSYEGKGGVQKNRYGYKGDGSFTRKDIIGQTYQAGKASYTEELESGTVVNGGANIGYSKKI